MKNFQECAWTVYFQTFARGSRSLDAFRPLRAQTLGSRTVNTAPRSVFAAVIAPP